LALGPWVMSILLISASDPGLTVRPSDPVAQAASEPTSTTGAALVAGEQTALPLNVPPGCTRPRDPLELAVSSSSGRRDALRVRRPRCLGLSDG
jgi:hypothetical protein